MLGPVTAAKAAAGSRTTGPAGGSPRTNHCSRAGQDGRPAPPRSAPAPAAAAAPPRRAAASVRGLGSDTSYTTQHPVYSGHCTLQPDTLYWWHLCWAGLPSAATVARLPWWLHGPELQQPRRARACFLLLCLAPPPPRPRPGDWGCC